MDVNNKKVTIIGMGRTALALAELLRREGARPFISESEDMPPTPEIFQPGVEYEFGGHTEKALENARLVIPSPGVPPTSKILTQAVRRGIQVMSEMEFASGFCRAPIFAVSGTNGKTTTTELLRELIASCGKTALLAGNNDTPFSAAVMNETKPDYIVLEVSSFQLEFAAQFKPWCATVLNITPDHLAWHGGMDGYTEAKAKIFANQYQGAIAVLNDDDPAVSKMPVHETADLWRFSLEHPVDKGLWLDGGNIREGENIAAQTSDTQLPGRHNLQNVLAALCMMRAGGFDWGKVLQGLRAFKGVEHRIEFVAEIEGVKYYNDSKSTNIDSLKAALESFERPIVLIAGGRGKGADYSVLRDLVASHVKTLVAIGEDAGLLAEAFGGCCGVIKAANMHDAVLEAGKAAVPGDIALLSPACASFDMYANFEERGKDFKMRVNALLERNAHEA